MASDTPIELTSVHVESAAVVSLPRRKAPIILASAMAVSLVTAIGVVVAIRLMSAAGDPAERMPASVAVFAAADLTPGSEQVRKLSKFTDPQASVDKLLAELEAKPDLGEWMGPRVAAGVWADPDGEPFVLVSLESRDDATATKGLTNIRSKEGIGYVVRQGRVLIATGGKAAGNQAAAEAAWAESEKAPLGKHAQYVDARKWLSGEQLAVVYVDLAALNRVMGKMLLKVVNEMGDEATPGDAQVSILQPEPPTTDLTGSVIAGVRVEDDGYLVRYRSIGGQAQTGTIADALTRLGALPAAADVAAVAHIPDELGPAMPILPLLFGGFGGFDDLDGQPDESDQSMDDPLTEAEFNELDELMSKPESKLTAAERKRLQELLDKLMPSGPTDQPGDITSGSDPFAGLDSFTDSTITVAVSGITQTPVFRVLIELAKDPDADLKSRLQSGQGKDVKVEVAGRAVTIASAAFPADSAKLADDPVFQRAVAGCPAAAQLALYANGAKVVAADVRDKVGQVRAIGLCQSAGDGGSTGTIRVLIE